MLLIGTLGMKGFKEMPAAHIRKSGKCVSKTT